MLDQALVLLFSGMLTVFVVLGLVVLLGRLLIFFLNRFAASPTSTSDLPLPIASVGPRTATITPETVAVIAATVEVATHGRGRVTTIEPLPQDDDLNL